MKKPYKNEQDIGWEDVITGLKLLRESYKTKLANSPTSYGEEDIKYAIKEIDEFLINPFAWRRVDPVVMDFAECLKISEDRAVEILKKSRTLIRARKILKTAIKEIEKEYFLYPWENVFDELESTSKGYHKLNKNKEENQKCLEYKNLVSYLEKEVTSLHPKLSLNSKQI